MNPAITKTLVGAVVTTVLTLFAPPANGEPLRDLVELWPHDVAKMASLPCVAGGPSARDTETARDLNPRLSTKMRGHLNAYNMSCARAVVQTVVDRGYNEKAAAIAISTIIVETSMANLDHGDRDSVGLYQQRASWGSFPQRTDPVWATSKFLAVMDDFYPNESWNTASIGDVAADVQRPAAQYRHRYAVEANDAVIIAGALFARPLPPSATVKVARHVADIDGDGKPDVLGLNTGSRESLWFVPNTSTPGSLSRGLSVHVSDGWQGVFEHHLADWDGDGKLDILGRSGDDLLVWLNTSIPGKPSFGRFVHLSAGWNALERLVFADFTGDGFVDVGGWNTGSRDQFWVVPNNSRPGVPGRGPSIHVSNGWHTIDTYLVADYDGDGKADLLGRGGDDLVAWRNTGSGGRPSFAPLSRLGSGWNAIGVLVVADFTGDGKPDIGGFDRATGHHFWVTPNTSTPGNLTRGGSYHVSDGWSNVSGHLLGDWDGDGKTDILGRAGDALLAWRNTSADGRTSLAPYTHFGTGWATLGTFLTKH
ncbi:VCBS repeat-containing protein [Allokutzneria sp. A3M-2-11 16]|uniref:FG-GAP repeat domain-containing protein n=1 Tax=Allokutzneria sp. A3M-2-11 16 TaxID=2962043 RepID=UPI0020B8415B|nr:VCBS repeat-containing protein [Allokutzneria sp. A3M-2-11 16]MCP3803811.1 VCBS repeat-containing protein [Allokutzneria sp. A3M-2-11 16]